MGKRLPPLQSHAFEWVRDWVRVIAALHHAIDKVEKPSLDGIRDNHDPDRPITHQSSSHLFPSSLFCFLVSSQSTISLQLLPPYAPRNETSIFVASYGSYSAISWSGISATPVITEFWILEPLACEFSYSVSPLKQLHCRIPLCLHIHNRYYHNSYIGVLTVNELVLMIRCQQHQFGKHALL